MPARKPVLSPSGPPRVSWLRVVPSHRRDEGSFWSLSKPVIGDASTAVQACSSRSIVPLGAREPEYGRPERAVTHFTNAGKLLTIFLRIVPAIPPVKGPRDQSLSEVARIFAALSIAGTWRNTTPQALRGDHRRRKPKGGAWRDSSGTCNTDSRFTHDFSSHYLREVFFLYYVCGASPESQRDFVQ